MLLIEHFVWCLKESWVCTTEVKLCFCKMLGNTKEIKKRKEESAYSSNWDLNTSILLSCAWFCLLLLLLLLLLLSLLNHQNITLILNHFFTRKLLLIDIILKASIRVCSLLHDRCRTMFFWAFVAKIKSSQCCNGQQREGLFRINPRGQRVHSAAATSGPIQTSVWATCIVRLFWKFWLPLFKAGENQLILSS